MLLKNSVNTEANIFGDNSISRRGTGASHVITRAGMS